jgi:hypothetical protein
MEEYESQPSLWPVSWRLYPGGARRAAAGEGRGPKVLRMTGEGDAVVERFHAAQLKRGRLPDKIERDRRAARQFIDFLGTEQGARPAGVNEYDLRVFLFDYYPRLLRTTERDALKLQVSLRRFFKFLAAEEDICCDWAEPLLRERAIYLKLWRSCPGPNRFEEAVLEWQDDLRTDLDLRVMVYEDMTEECDWSWLPRGDELPRLKRELSRRWLAWRDEVIRGGTIHRDAAREVLVKRQEKWETTPHPGYGGRMPVEVVEQELARHPTVDIRSLLPDATTPVDPPSGQPPLTSA